jgi:hypothetical protein
MHRSYHLKIVEVSDKKEVAHEEAAKTTEEVQRLITEPVVHLEQQVRVEVGVRVRVRGSSTEVQRFMRASR